MNIKRFLAPTSREALAKARAAFGEGTLILSNRPTPNGVEVVATAEDTLTQLAQAEGILPANPSNSARANAAPEAAPAPSRQSAAPAALPPARNPVQEDTERLAMSTLSFQDYVRERMLRRRHEVSRAQMEPHFEDSRAAATGSTTLSQAHSPAEEPVATPARPVAPVAAAQEPELAAAPAAAVQPIMAANAVPGMAPQGIVNELQAMKELIEERFNAMAWLGQARQHPIHSNLMLKLIRAGYSPAVSRAVLEPMPPELDAAAAVRWVMDVLERNLKTDAGQPAMHEAGGVYALIGATGVGKTTTAAKLAALCARRHGANSVGLITLDTYRVAAHEQLRAYGRMLGVVAHLAHDRAALQDLLGLLASKKMVLIDTTGLAPRDPRTRDMLELLNLPKVNRMLVVNAGGHGDTLDDVMSSFKGTGIHGAVLSKTDEAAKLGPALDALIRHQLVLRGVTNGQRVPDDWEAADAAKLVRMSMRTPGKSAFDPKPADLGFLFAQSSQGMTARSSLHA